MILPGVDLSLEARRLIENLGRHPVKVGIFQHENEMTLIVQEQDRVAQAYWKVDSSDMELSFSDFSEKILCPAAHQCAQILEEMSLQKFRSKTLCH